MSNFIKKFQGFGIALIRRIPLGIMSLFMYKILTNPVTYPDALVLLILAALSAFYEYYVQNREAKLLHARMDASDAILTDHHKKIDSLASKSNMQNINKNNIQYPGIR